MKLIRFFIGIREFIRGRFNLHADSAEELEIHDRVEASVIISGTNLWVLIFATIIASIGLNMNSTAVIIGAMLISPLMGPTTGMGFSLGINDFELLKRSAKNFGFMTIIAILASTCYFALSPWQPSEQSELLARTQPTTWDVLIAFFGGLAGILGQTRQEKSITVIPGVAIATALMPPLCTAGFGLATGQYNYVFGAIYLFIINAVFIGLAAFVFTNWMGFEKKSFVDPAYGRRVKRLMVTIIIVTIVPSVFIGYNLIRETIFKQNVSRYISKAFSFKEAKVIDHKSIYTANRNEENSIEVILYGKPISKEAIELLRTQMENYGINRTKLIVRQGDNNTDITSSYITANFEELIKNKNDEIKGLTGEINRLKSMSTPSAELLREMGAIIDRTDLLATINRSVMYDNKGEAIDTLLVCYIIQNKTRLTTKEIERVTSWLKARTNSTFVKVVEESNPTSKINELKGAKARREERRTTSQRDSVKTVTRTDSITINDLMKGNDDE